uniref:Thiamine phosphate synthase/TenI domain-containing protein n=1 Tax=Chromera velia CCMP2878 TaxID=1169474 RepID=A0A0G4I3P9_9ALVE|eukprot:Cvel_10725.t1-p1 / transcript=Cvel_10725.t1 / gene=Cvel_10725 / organism=Chromera_velia_CCMP2878 / gene_product=hypothetical protein / transcript_product=hypothetical protein / location=Cvel_scaffold653:13659-16275(+) / protein_length=367 / sequence_SO=supercontig / SO=protein_coding / is_pseudo=false
MSRAGPMHVVLFTSERSCATLSTERELRIVEHLFNHCGLSRLHVRKPGWRQQEVETYVKTVPPKFRRRLVLHQHHDLALSLSLGGIHLRGADRQASPALIAERSSSSEGSARRRGDGNSLDALSLPLCLTVESEEQWDKRHGAKETKRVEEEEEEDKERKQAVSSSFPPLNDFEQEISLTVSTGFHSLSEMERSAREGIHVNLAEGLRRWEGKKNSSSRCIQSEEVIPSTETSALHLADDDGRSSPASDSEDPPHTSSTRLRRIPQVIQPDYAFLSPIFPSISKEGYRPGAFSSLPGNELQRRLCGVPFPVFALGGISEKNVLSEKLKGFAGVGLLGSVWQSPDPVAAFSEIREMLYTAGGNRTLSR